MATGNGNRWTAGHNARPGNQAFIDRVTKIDRQKRTRSHITHASKARLKGLVRVDYCGKRALKRGVLEIVYLVIAISARPQMRMAINQSRQDRGMGEIDHSCARGYRTRAKWSHALDALPGNHDQHVLADTV